ncbi:hypothetical protein SUGI_0539070 [Cryptomeria japonica]|nr:hypothetical protein SUGI_0539070 [Cryptomeria japonica]
MFAIRSEGEEDKILEISLEEDHMAEQIQFDMDYEDDEDDYINTASNIWMKKTCFNHDSRHDSVEVNDVNKFETGRVLHLFPRFSSSPSRRTDLCINSISNGAPRSSRGGKFPFGSNCASPMTPKGGCWSTLSKLEEIPLNEENEMEEPVPEMQEPWIWSFYG